ncbi:MAG: hypothetical protein KC561_07330 [Myxococcales bacterium]|nr:hypothetical protein [Myxococcales bacterium]
MNIHHTRLSIPLFVGLVLLTLSSVQADDPVTITVSNGTLLSGESAQLDLEISNTSITPIKLFHIAIDYDTIGGATLAFETQDAFTLDVPAGQTLTQQVTFRTADAAGETIVWTAPYSQVVRFGADAEAFAAAAAALDDPEAIESAMSQSRFFQRALERAQRNEPERIAALPDSARWFDADAFAAQREPLGEALCTAFARQLERAHGGQPQVELFTDLHQRLLAVGLYQDCIPLETRMTIARSMVRMDRPQDALMFIALNEDGSVPEEWRQIYIDGRLEMARTYATARAEEQFRPGIESLNEAFRVAPDDPRLPAVADTLLQAYTAFISTQLAEGEAIDALDSLLAVTENFGEHPLVVASMEAVAEGLIVYGENAANEGNAIRANNAFIRGGDAFEGRDFWESRLDRLQAARRAYYTRTLDALIAAGGLDQADELYEEAIGRRVDYQEADIRALLTTLIEGHWAAVHETIDAGELETALVRANRVLERDHAAEILGERVAQTYLEIGTKLVDQIGLLGAAFGGNAVKAAKEALDKGKDADPAAAAAALSTLSTGAIIVPVVFGAIFLVAGAVLLLKGKWRKRGKAKRLWSKGVSLANSGDLGQAASQLDQAYHLLFAESDASAIVGEQSVGHMVLKIADLHKKRGRTDQLEMWHAEWKGLEEFERPFDPDFDTALEQYAESRA